MSEDRAIKTKEKIKLLKETMELQIITAQAINDTLSDIIKQINELATDYLKFVKLAVMEQIKELSE